MLRYVHCAYEKENREQLLVVWERRFQSEVIREGQAGNEMNGLVVNTAGVAVRSTAIDPKGKKAAVNPEYVGELSFKRIN